MQKFEDLSVAQRLLAERSGRLPTGGGTYPFDEGGAFPGLRGFQKTEELRDQGIGIVFSLKHFHQMLLNPAKPLKYLI